MNPEDAAREAWAASRRAIVQRHAEAMSNFVYSQPAPVVVDVPIVDGGQGRTASSVVRSSRVLAWCAVALVVLVAAALVYAKVTR